MYTLRSLKIALYVVANVILKKLGISKNSYKIGQNPE